MNDFFNTLGIEATKEEKKIKKAYRARLHAVNPEDDPDGFKRLREAYEEALKYLNLAKTHTPINTTAYGNKVNYGNYNYTEGTAPRRNLLIKTI